MDPGDTLRADLEQAFVDADDAEGAPVEAADPVEPVETEPEAPETEDQDEETPAAKAERERDEAGRFAKKSKEAAAVKAAQTAPVQTLAQGAKPAAGAAPTVDMKAPQSWTPAAREQWATLPPDVRAQVAKREKEIAVAMQESAPARKFHSDFREAIAPYQPMLGNADPVPVVKSLLQTAHQLAYAPPAHKAGILAHLVHSYGVPIEDLAAALDAKAGGQPQRAGAAQQPQQLRDPRVDQLLAQQQHDKQQRDQALMTSAKAKLEEFAKTHEFFEDVRETMADIHLAQTKRGLKPTPEQLYTLACQATPEVAAVLAKRGPSPQANSKESTQRARAAASSIKGQPAPVGKKGQPDDLRGTLEAAIRGEL